MHQLSKTVSRQDANFKLSPSASNETSINLPKDISDLISDDSGYVTFILHQKDFITALSSLCLLENVYFKKEQDPASSSRIFRGLASQINAQFGQDDLAEYTIYHIKREDGRSYFNNLKQANGFNLRAFLVEQYSTLTFQKDDDGKLTIRLSMDIPVDNRDSEPKKVVVTPPIDAPLQLIYYGAPGTGKSFAIDEMTDGGNAVRTTFHPDSDYASFAGAYKPTMEDVPMSVFVGKDVHLAQPQGAHPGIERKIVYKYVPQAFLKAYVEAWKDLDNPHFLIIEEINRGNCAQIFGDLFQLLDRNNSGSSAYPIHADEDIARFLKSDAKGFANLTDAQRQAIASFTLQKDNGREIPLGREILDGNLLLLPPNLYIWATMNTSDQSLFPIDSAFKRRWNWRYVPIDTDPLDRRTGLRIDWKFRVGENLYSWGEFLDKINPEILALTESSDKQMGYFFAKADPRTGVIAEEVLLNKVLFYLWTDVFKDYDISSKYFHNPNTGRSFLFTDFFTDPQALHAFIANCGLRPLGSEESGIRSEE